MRHQERETNPRKDRRQPHAEYRAVQAAEKLGGAVIRLENGKADRVASVRGQFHRGAYEPFRAKFKFGNFAIAIGDAIDLRFQLLLLIARKGAHDKVFSITERHLT